MSLDPSHELFSTPGELRAVTDEATGLVTLVGYAAVWNALSSIALPGPQGKPFWERIAPRAFTDSLLDPELACFNDHKTNQVLGRVGAGTLDCTEDDHGLRFACRLGKQSYVFDLLESIERRDVWGCSFGFYTRAQEWNRDEQGRMIRTITQAKLFDVSPCGRPTYRETGLALRSLGEWEAAESPDDGPGRLALARAKIRLAESRHR